MSAAKHTPGPWRTSKPREEFGLVWARDVEVARSSDYQSLEEQRANARLISAAPEMLSEMKRYLPLLERIEADPSLWERATVSLGIATLNGYRAAISKATGEQP